MSDRIPCEFFLIRYVPDVVKGEFTNIGVLLREAGVDAARNRTMHVRFTRDWKRVRCVDANADIALLEALEAEVIARADAEQRGAGLAKPLLSVLEDTLSNSIQITEPRACLAETVSLELEQLMRMYVEPMRAETSRQRTGRAVIAAAMRREFERTGAWAQMRKRIAASLYTRPGDPMKLDCGYRPNGVIRIFHAVSLENDVEAAKSLAWSAPLLARGIERVDKAELHLTAVVEPLREVSRDVSAAADFEDEAAMRYEFGKDLMEQQAIRVITVNDLARAAETARIEMRL